MIVREIDGERKLDYQAVLDEIRKTYSDAICGEVVYIGPPMTEKKEFEQTKEIFGKTFPDSGIELNLLDTLMTLPGRSRNSVFVYSPKVNIPIMVPYDNDVLDDICIENGDYFDIRWMSVNSPELYEEVKTLVGGELLLEHDTVESARKMYGKGNEWKSVDLRIMTPYEDWKLKDFWPEYGIVSNIDVAIFDIPERVSKLMEGMEIKLGELYSLPATGVEMHDGAKEIFDQIEDHDITEEDIKQLEKFKKSQNKDSR